MLIKSRCAVAVAQIRLELERIISGTGPRLAILRLGLR